MNDFGFQKRSIGESIVPRRSFLRQRGGGRWQRIKSGLRHPWQRLVEWVGKPRTRRDWKMLILKTIGVLFGVAVLTVIVLWFSLPNIDDPATMFASQSTVILDREGVELYRLFSEQDRTFVRGDAISNFAKDATIAIEDERFFGRSTCFDVIGFSRAVMSQLFPNYFVRSGGSTLTQQFAGNAFVGRQWSFIRKARELLLACKLEGRYDKNQLLELYLNWVPFGHNAYGIEQASKNYFNASAKDLSLGQAAVLAAMLQRPSYFNPYGSHLKTNVSEQIVAGIMSGKIKTTSDIPSGGVQVGLIGRRVGSGATTLYIGGRTDQVLESMVKQSKITQEQRNQALDELQKMTFSSERQNIRAAHFVLSIQQKAQEILGIDEGILEQGGFRITTTLDWDIQQAAEKAVANHAEDVIKRFGAHNVALVAVAPQTREVLAYVGNSDYSDEEHEGKIDMAVSPRQPGSSFKPFTYLAAFEAGYGPGSVIYDVPTKFGSDQPENYDGTFWGLTSIRKALGGSRNIPAIKAFFLGGGEEPVLSLASRMGVTAPLDQRKEYRKDQPDFSYGWPIAIGSAEVPLLQMVEGYATIADGGVYRPAKDILKITDKDGNILYTPKEDAPQQVVDQRLTAEITSILSDVDARPANEYWKTILSVPGYAAAAKTGTSNKCLERDEKGGCTLRRPESTWTMGFTPNLIAGVWAGNATSQSLFDKADGLTTAAPIWHDFMYAANRKIENPQTTFSLPQGLSHPLISRLSGKLASACTPPEFQSTDLFLDENVPSEEDPACALLNVDKVTGLLASEACPAEAAGESAFFIPQSEAPTRWPLWESAVQEWATKQMERWNSNETHSGSMLPLPVAPTKVCDPALTPGRFTKPSVLISAPRPGDSVSYPSFTPSFSVTSVAKVKEVKIEIDGKPLRTFDSAPFEGSVRVPRTIDQSGNHTITVTVTDEYFNTASDSVDFRFE